MDTLLVGRFGDSSLVLDHSRPWYLDRGVSIDRSLDGVVPHPILEMQLLATNGSVRDMDESHVSNDWSDVASLFPDSHPLDAALTALVESRLGASRVEDETHVARVDEASNFLETFVPHLWRDARAYVSRIFLVEDHRLSGASWVDTLGAVCLGPGVGNSMWEDAANLLHEALHAKTARTTRSFGLPNPPRTSDVVAIPWWSLNGGVTLWDVKRCIDALYVYTHLSHLFEVLEANGVVSEVPYARCAFRANYLSRVLSDLPEQIFGPDWCQLVSWLCANVPMPRNLASRGQRILDHASFPVAQCERFWAEAARGR